MGQQTISNQITVFKDSMGEWRFTLTCNGIQDKIRSSHGHITKENALNTIEQLLLHIHEDNCIAYNVNAVGKHFFTIATKENQLIAVSRNLENLLELKNDLSRIRLELKSSNTFDIKMS